MPVDRSLELANAMLMSAWTDSWVDIPVDEDRFLELLNERRSTSRHGEKKKSGEKTLDMKASW